MKKLLTTLSILILAGCAAKGEKTSAELKLFSGQLAISSYTGGVMLWGSSTDGQNAFGKLLTSNTFEIELSNGTWNFVAIGWDGGTQMTGTPHCAAAKAIELGGEAVAVDLSLSNSNCADSIISSGATTGSFDYTFPRLQASICNSDAPLDGTGCGVSGVGYASSVQAFFPAYAKVDGAMVSVDIASGLKDNCHTVDGATAVGQALSPFSIPTGGAGSPLLTIVRAYMGDSDCEGLTDTALSSPIDYTFPTGLLGGGGAPLFAGTYTVNPSPYSHQVASLELAMDKATLCSAERIAASPFAAGEGDLGRPYVICSITQLDGIGGDANWSTYNSSHFILGKSVDYFTENGIDLTTVQATGAEPNYPDSIPLGEGLTTAPTPYSGTFDGRGHKIIGFKVEDLENVNANVDRVGFIRDMSTSGVLRNVSFILPLIEGKTEDQTNIHSKIGTAVGANAGIIRNVKIVLGEVFGSTQIGGVVGRNDGIIEDVHTKLMRIEGFDTVGGIAGAFANAGAKHINRAVFEGTVRGRGRGYCSINSYHDEPNCTGNSGVWYDNFYIGGIVGVLETCQSAQVDIQQTASHGQLSGFDYVGGLIGKVAGANCALNDSYSDTSVIAKKSTNSAGLVGWQNGADFTPTRVFRAAGPAVSSDGSLFQDFSTSIAGGSTLAIDPTYTASGTTYTSVRTQSSYTAIGLDFVNIWAMDDDGHDYPRLLIEAPRTCSGKISLSPFAGGSGSASSPFEICSQAQLGEVKNYAGSGYHFKLLRDISLKDFTTGTNSYLDIASFVGVLDGNDKAIYPVDLTSSQVGLIDTIDASSKVKNLEVVSYYSMPTVGSAGILAGTNNGAVIKVKTKGYVNLTGSASASCLVGTNNGAILGSKAGCKILASGSPSDAIGGLTNINSGAILYSEFEGEILVSSTMQRIGGLVGRTAVGSASSFYEPVRNETISFGGANGSIIEENTFDGKITLSGSGLLSSEIGGLVGSMASTLATVKNNQLWGEIIYDGPSGTDYYNYLGQFASAPAAGTADNMYVDIGNGDVYVDNGATFIFSHNIGPTPYPSTTIGYTPKANYVGGICGKGGNSGSVIENNYINTHYRYTGIYPNILNNTWSAICGALDSTTMNGNFFVWNPQPENFNSTNTGGEYGAYAQSSNNLNTLNYIGDFDSGNSTASLLYALTPDANFYSLVNGDIIHLSYGQFTVSDDSTAASSYVTVAEAIGSITNGTPMYVLEPVVDDVMATAIFGTDLGWDLGVDWDDVSAPWVIEEEGRPFLVRQEHSSEDFSLDLFVQTYLNNR